MTEEAKFAKAQKLRNDPETVARASAIDETQPRAAARAQPQDGAEKQARTAGIRAEPGSDEYKIEELARKICAAHGVPDGDRLVSEAAPEQIGVPGGYVHYTRADAQRPMWESYKDVARVAIGVQNENKAKEQKA